MTIIITINLSDTLTVLMRTTGYIGAKQLDNDKDAFKRISLTEGDEKLLLRFWRESCDALCAVLRRQIDSEGMEDDSYRLDLRVSKSFDTSLLPTLQNMARDFVLQFMAAKWLSITDKDAAESYAAESATSLCEIVRHVYCKRRPQRPTYI